MAGIQQDHPDEGPSDWAAVGGAGLQSCPSLIWVLGADCGWGKPGEGVVNRVLDHAD